MLFTLLFPLFQTYLYFDLMATWSASIQKGIYAVTKVVMLLLPIVYLGIVCKERFWLRKFNARGLVEGAAFGLLVLLVMCLLYFCCLKPLGIISPESRVAESITERVAVFGITHPAMFILFGVFVSFIHSGLEEYYWRWFAFILLRRVMPTTLSAIVSGVAFSLHHVILLGTYIGYNSPLAWLFSFGIAMGGAYWCWLYYRKDSIYAPWLSHAIIDIAIFIVGYDLVFAA